MAALTSTKRKALPDSAFAGPGRSFPIQDKSHARNALARAAQSATPDLQSTIKTKVKKRFPSIAVEGQAATKRIDRMPRHGGR
jgi:hypothetical protein